MKKTGRLPLETDELLGIIYWNSTFRLYGAWLADWILDYPTYDPGYDTYEEQKLFRGGLLVVRPDQGAEYCEVMRENEIDREELKEYLKHHASRTPLDFYVDFSRALFVNGFHEVPIEDYVPAGWTGIEDEAMDYLPDDIKAFWNHTSDS